MFVGCCVKNNSLIVIMSFNVSDVEVLVFELFVSLRSV